MVNDNEIKRILQAIRGAIDNRVKKVDNLKINKEVSEIMVTWAHENFEQEGKVWGGRGGKSFGYGWFQLAPSTIKSRKKKKKWPGKILQVTGQLASSLMRQVTKTTITIFYGKKYAEYLHFGTKNMPPRPILPSELPPKVLEDIKEAVEKYWAKEMK